MKQIAVGRLFIDLLRRSLVTFVGWDLTIMRRMHCTQSHVQEKDGNIYGVSSMDP